MTRTDHSHRTTASERSTRVRVGLFFAAAVVWIVGAVYDQPVVTGAAIGIAAAGVLLRFARRREGERE